MRMLVRPELWVKELTLWKGGEPLTNTPPLPAPEAPASELAPLLALSRDRVMETMRYKVGRADRDTFLSAMAEVEHVRGRTGAIVWRLYEDVAGLPYLNKAKGATSMTKAFGLPVN